MPEVPSVFFTNQIAYWPLKELSSGDFVMIIFLFFFMI